jgi:hypothetical protein
MLRRPRSFALAHAIWAVVALSWAISPPLAWAQARALSIRFVAAKTTFQPREPIEIELVFGADASTTAFDLREGPGGWRDVDVVLDHMDGVATPLRPLDAGFDDRWKGDAHRDTRLTLNGWYRFDAAGTYRVQVRSKSNSSWQSNALLLEIAKRDPRWEESTLKRAIQVLDSTATPAVTAAALSSLRSLGTNAAAAEIARRYRNAADLDGYDEIMLRGLFIVADRRFVVDALRKETRRPARRIDGWLVRGLALLEMASEHPEGPPFSHDEYLSILDRESTARAQAIAIDGGPGALESEIAKELSDLGRYEDYFLAGALAPALRNFPSESVAAFRALDVEPQLNILLWSWRRISFAAMVPALKFLYLSPKEDWAKLRDLALRRLFDLAPDEARPLMLAELERDELRVSTDTLARLGPVTFPNLEPLWLRRLEDGILDERLDGAVRLERFGSAAVLADVKRLYAANRSAWSCDVRAAVVGYFMRVDRPAGEQAAKEALAAPAGESETCKALTVSAPVPSAGAMILASGPVPGDESHLRFSIGEAVYDSPDALVAALSHWPRGTTVGWRYQEGTATTHLERWTLTERAVVFERVRRSAAERGIMISLAR